jgi:RNA polymerase sigma-70 factor (ECF subfamily)
MTWTEVPDPVPGPGEALVRLAVAGVNYMDTGVRTTPTRRWALPAVLGVDGMGHVTALGDGVEGLAVGERVAWYYHPGSYAEQLAIPADSLVQVPDYLDDETAAAVMMQGLTANHFTTETYAVKPGDTAVVHAAAGGVGLMLTQMIKARGGIVIGLVSREEKTAIAKEAGADHVLLSVRLSHRRPLSRQWGKDPDWREEPVDDQAWQAEQFERHRDHLRAVAYRMLGSVTEAEDAVQEAWLRLSRSGNDAAINNIGGWLTTVVGRVCLDMLRARRSRREHYVGSWEPEPVATEGDASPEQEALLADSVGLALLVVLETLNPAERLAFVLHDMFGVPFEDIAPLVERSPAATRQLASRARRRVHGAAPQPDAGQSRQREVVAAFLAAARGGDFDALVAVLDPDVVFRSDTGERPWLAPALLTGAADVARHAATSGRRFAALCQLALVNGTPGVIVPTPAGPLAVASFTITGGRITTIHLILDPAKIRTQVIDGD